MTFFEIRGDITAVEVIAAGRGVRRARVLRKRYGGTLLLVRKPAFDLGALSTEAGLDLLEELRGSLREDPDAIPLTDDQRGEPITSAEGPLGSEERRERYEQAFRRSSELDARHVTRYDSS